MAAGNGRRLAIKPSRAETRPVTLKRREAQKRRSGRVVGIRSANHIRNLSPCDHRFIARYAVSCQLTSTEHFFLRPFVFPPQRQSQTSPPHPTVFTATTSTMFSQKTLVVVLAAAAASAFAQSSSGSSAAPTSTAGISACVLTCVSSAAASAGCSGVSVSPFPDSSTLQSTN